jgi:hypothetical protein
MIMKAYFKAAGRACVEYEIRDPVEAGSMGINTTDLYDETANELWTNKEYQVLILSNVYICIYMDGI